MTSSPQDSRNYGNFPNTPKTIQGAQLFEIQSVESRAVVPVKNSAQPAFVPGQSFQLSAVAAAVAGNTAYTGVFNPTLVTGSPAVIQGFQNAANNGKFSVVSCTPTTLTVNNAAGVLETHVGTVEYDCRVAGSAPQNSRV